VFYLDQEIAMSELGSLQVTGAANTQNVGMEPAGNPKCDYAVTNTGRLTISDFSSLTGAQSGDKFILLGPKGRTKTWRIIKVPAGDLQD
jgi:hypothetical protein